MVSQSHIYQKNEFKLQLLINDSEIEQAVSPTDQDDRQRLKFS